MAKGGKVREKAGQQRVRGVSEGRLLESKEAILSVSPFLGVVVARVLRENCAELWVLRSGPAGAMVARCLKGG